jgi:TolA-binding protein
MRSFSLAAAAALVLVVLSAGWSAKPAAAQEKPPAAQAKSSPEALRIYTDAANFQNNGAFDLGAEEWEKFVQRFPQDPLAGKAQYYAGVCRLQLQQHDKAIAHFEAAVANFPKFELAEDARFNLAAAQYGLAGLESTPPEKRQELYNSAAAAYGALIEQFPQGKYLDRALFWRGEALYRLDKKAEAIQAYGRVVQEHPKSSLRPDALYVLGVTQEELTQHADAGKTYDTFLAEFANHELAAEVRMRKAETLLQTGKLAEAEKQFGEVAALENFAQADHAVSRQALAIARQDRFVDAANLYATIPTRWPQSPYVDESRIEAARAFYRAEQFDQAATWLQQVIDSKSKFASEAAHWLSRIYLRRGEPQKAAELAAATLPSAKNDAYLPALKMDQAEGLLESGAKEEALTRFTSIAQEHANTEHAAPALYNAAFAAMSLGRHDQSLKTAQDFLTKFPNDRLAPDVKYIAAESHLQLRNPTEAATLFADLASSAGDHPDLPLWRLRWANTLYLQKKYQETIDTLTPLLKTFEKPNDAAEAQFLIGASRFYLNQPAEAAQALAASVEAAPMGPRAEEALLVLSRAYRSENKLDEAKAAVSRLLQAFPQGSLRDQASYRLGEYLYAAGQHAEAIQAYDAVITNHAQSVYAPYALYGKGWALLQAKQFAPAAENLSTLLKNYPQHELRAEALFARAMSRRQTGDQQGAIDDITAYLAAGGNQEHRLEALYERGLAELALNQPAAAAKTFESILKEKPDYLAADKALYQLAWAHKTAGDNDKALAYFARLAQEHPNSPLAPEAHFHLGEKQYDDENYADAAKSYATAKQKAARGDLKERAIYKLGWANYQQKIYQAALAEFNEHLTAFPQGALAGEAQFMKAESLFKMGDYANALPAYDAALQKPLADETAKSLVLLHAGQAAGQLKQWEVSLRHLESLIETYPESPYLAEAIYERGFVRQNQGQLDAAMADYLQAAEASRGSVGARARFMRGELFFTQKNYDEAVKEFQRVMFGFGGEQSPEDVKPWQAKSGYEAARCRDVQIQAAKTAAEKTKAIEEARRYYSYVVERHPTNDLTPAAKKRLEELQKL